MLYLCLHEILHTLIIYSRTLDLQALYGQRRFDRRPVRRGGEARVHSGQITSGLRQTQRKGLMRRDTQMRQFWA